MTLGVRSAAAADWSWRSIFDFKYEDFSLEGYDPWPHIKAPVAV